MGMAIKKRLIFYAKNEDSLQYTHKISQIGSER